MSEEKKEVKKCKCLMVIGIILLAIGLLADVIGLGNSEGFGPKQIAFIMIGIVLILAGTKSCKIGKCCK